MRPDFSRADYNSGIWMEPLVRFASIDMTLALGADSYLRQGQAGQPMVAADPTGQHCLKNLIDLVINSNVCFLALPSGEDYSSRPVLVERLSKLQSIPNCAAVNLKPSIERRVFRAFWETIGTLGQTWVSQWFKSQFWNPIVTLHHHPRLGPRARTFRTITDEGWEIWKASISHSMLEDLPLLATSLPDESYLKEDVNRAGGLIPFEYCYAFDVFRRGWQYAEATRRTNLDIKYCPHLLRQRALQGASDGWIETARDQFWSWGGCIIHAIEAAQSRPQAEEVCDWINGLLDSNAPRWTRMPAAPDTARVDSVEYRQELRELIDRLNEVARAARIPRTLLRALSPVQEAGEIATEAVREQFHLGTIHALLQVLPVHEILEPISYSVSETLKDAFNFYQKGTFGYPGLISHQLERQAAGPSSGTILL